MELIQQQQRILIYQNVLAGRYLMTFFEDDLEVLREIVPVLKDVLRLFRSWKETGQLNQKEILYLHEINIIFRVLYGNDPCTPIDFDLFFVPEEE
ncbi:hypothetical protein [Kiloniella sp. b19]|uniref:hypothetical protein n=1 Tax=Kiloniella sp. GXU_MW_B19 TaxID=3141326 RepID=UPI0031E2BCEC